MVCLLAAVAENSRLVLEDPHIRDSRRIGVHVHACFYSADLGLPGTDLLLLALPSVSSMHFKNLEVKFVESRGINYVEKTRRERERENVRARTKMQSNNPRPSRHLRGASETLGAATGSRRQVRSRRFCCYRHLRRDRGPIVKALSSNTVKKQTIQVRHPRFKIAPSNNF